MKTIYIGYDPREDAAFAIARASCKYHQSKPIPVWGLVLDDLIRQNLYRRPIEMRPSAADKPVMWDVVSDAPMATQHACARFFVPILSGGRGWALFTDGDMMFMSDVNNLFDQLDSTKAVYCVHHKHEPNYTVKMDGQAQTVYPRKNWSSVIAFNCEHAANRPLYDLNFLNTTPGRDLHRLCWLDDKNIGELDQSWNYLVGHSDPDITPDIVHFTDGVPNMTGYEDAPFASAWFMWRNKWARGGWQ